MRNNINNPLLKYIRDTFAKEDELLTNIRNKAIKANRPITINPEDGRLLQLLIKMNNVNKILEIGTFFGYSTIWLARSKEDIHIYTIEKDKESYEEAENNFIKARVNNKITILKDKAENILQNLNEKFDMVFIDAEKNHYLQYLDWAEKNIKKGGLIVADNTLLSGAVYMDELPYRIRESTKKNIIEFNKKLADKKKYTSILLPAEDGITIAIKEF